MTPAMAPRRLKKSSNSNPICVVMDLGMPVMTGLQAAPEIAKAHPQLPMLLISVQEVSRQLALEARKPATGAP